MDLSGGHTRAGRSHTLSELDTDYSSNSGRLITTFDRPQRRAPGATLPLITPNESVRRDVPAGKCTASRAGCRGTETFCAPHVYNNPVKYLDPTGHCGAEAAASSDDSYYTGYAEYYECIGLRAELEGILGTNVEGIWYLWQMETFLEGAAAIADGGFSFVSPFNDDTVRSALQEYVSYWAANIDSLEASARTVEFASILGGDIEDLIAVLSGHIGDGTDGNMPSAAGPYSTAGLETLSTSGFNSRYRDPDPNNNQVHHTWFYVQVGYYQGDVIAWLGNVVHEIRDPGGSLPDYLAGNWGIQVGDAVRRGDLSLVELAESMRVELGE